MRVHDRKEFLKLSGLGALTAHLFGKEVDATPAAEVEGVEPVRITNHPPLGWKRPYNEHQYSLDDHSWITVGWSKWSDSGDCSVAMTPGPHLIPHGTPYVRRRNVW